MAQWLLLQMLFSLDFVVTDHPAKPEKQRKCGYPYRFADDKITENRTGHRAAKETQQQHEKVLLRRSTPRHPRRRRCSWRRRILSCPCRSRWPAP